MDFLNLVFSEYLNNTVVPFGHVLPCVLYYGNGNMKLSCKLDLRLWDFCVNLEGDSRFDF